jgi:prepilin-type N-terminal cleavage/methylation domain-containing protein
MKRQAGVTLIELLIVIAIIGIISAIALPAYRDYVIRGQLTDSQASLGATRTRLEQYYQDNRSYPTECGGTAAGLPAFAIPTSQYFTYACTAGAAAGQTFILTATGVTGCRHQRLRLHRERTGRPQHDRRSVRRWVVHQGRLLDHQETEHLLTWPTVRRVRPSSNSC